jgi:branched-chain amino acid transport system ATP-binding protein
MILSVNNLEVSYGAIKALHGVSLHIDRGEIVTLIGANGAGKTTLLRAISGLIKSQAGEIEFDDGGQIISLARLKAHQIVRHGIGHSPEGRQVFATLTVQENLRLGGYQQPAVNVQTDIERCFGMFPVLQERRNQKAGTLSGGEQQMLAIGRALMARPKLLLLDEPSLGLAPLIVRKIFSIIQEINAAGMTVFLVEQNAHMALNIAHRAYVLQTGKIIKSDAAKNLLEDPEVKAAYLGG